MLDAFLHDLPWLHEGQVAIDDLDDDLRTGLTGPGSLVDAGLPFVAR
jgi:hypothetical protein